MREAAAHAPGRVNLIGEHTDYQEGFVLPCAVPQRTAARVRRRGDRRVRAASAQMPDVVEFELGREQRQGGWVDYIQGLTSVLSQRGFTLEGFDLTLESEVPLGSGLSSSAALEVSTLRALRDLFALELSDIDIARLAQRAEVDFVGAPVGIMDQMASSLAGERDALFLDTRTLQFERITLPETLELVVINSGVTHHHAGGDYVTRRRESEDAAGMLGVRYLRDVHSTSTDQLDHLPPVLRRRARHIISENARVLEAVTALRTADLPALGRLFNASHASMRDDYEISIPEVDLLVELARRRPEVYGARLTGGGFGGAIVAAVAAGGAVTVAHDTARAYERATGNGASVLVPLT